MKPLFLKLTGALALAGIIASCSDGGGGFAGIGGSGFISTGTVTGFGSVFVNGVEFETGSTTFEVEDASGSQNDLRIGMVVQVEGRINTDGITGTATRIHYGDLLEGPISAIVEDTANMTKTLTIMGNTVMVTSADTAFKNVTYGSLVTNYVVEISGFYDNTNTLQATYVEYKSIYNPSTIVEINGTISGLTGSSFIVKGINVNAASANLNNLPNGLQNGALVEVKGTYNDSSNIITATEIEGEDNDLRDDGSKVSIEGYITRYVDNNDFDIDGYRVDASTATFEPASLTLSEGIKVDAEGTVINSVLVATEIESRSGNAEVNAYVNSIDTVNNRFTVNVVPGQPPVTVQLTTSTSMEDNVGTDDHLSISELVANNFVEVRGYETDVSTITATRVKRTDPGNIELQGIITAESTDVSVTVLGVEFLVDAATTEYEDQNGTPYADHAALMIDTTLNQTVIGIEDKKFPDGNAVGIADSVEIEIP